MYDKEGVGSLDALACAVRGGANALAEAAEFVGVGVVSHLLEIWVLSKLPVFECLPCGFVKDGKGPFVYEG